MDMCAFFMPKTHLGPMLFRAQVQGLVLCDKITPHVYGSAISFLWNLCLHRKYYLTFSAFNNKTKTNPTTGSKENLMWGPQEISGLKSTSLIPNGFQVIEWLLFSENHMKFTTCLDAYRLLAKSSQAFVLGVTNFWDP